MFYLTTINFERLKDFWKKDMVKENINLNPFLEPSAIVLNPNAPDSGSGQVQSKIGSKVTINFENIGKILIDGSLLDLEMVN